MQLSLNQVLGATALGFMLADITYEQTMPVRVIGYALAVTVTSVALSVLFGSAGFYAGLALCTLSTLGNWIKRGYKPQRPLIDKLTPQTLDPFLKLFADKLLQTKKEVVLTGQACHSGKFNFTITLNNGEEIEMDLFSQFTTPDEFESCIPDLIKELKASIEQENKFEDLRIHSDIIIKLNDRFIHNYFDFSIKDQYPTIFGITVANTAINDVLKEKFKLDDNLNFIVENTIAD